MRSGGRVRNRLRQPPLCRLREAPVRLPAERAGSLPCRRSAVSDDPRSGRAARDPTPANAGPGKVKKGKTRRSRQNKRQGITMKRFLSSSGGHCLLLVPKCCRPFFFFLVSFVPQRCCFWCPREVCDCCATSWGVEIGDDECLCGT